MIYRLFLIVACTVGTANFALAQVEGIASLISSTGSYGQCRKIFEFTQEDFAAFTSLRVETDAEMKRMWETMDRPRSSVVDEPTNQAWISKHGPLVRQINYDLWQSATKILKTEGRIKKYHRMVLQEYLRLGHDVRCTASLLGKQLTWKQIESLREKLANNPVKVQNALAKQRRVVEEDTLLPFIDRKTLQKARGEEFQWKTNPPEFHDVHFSPFEELAAAGDKTLMRVAAHEDVLDGLKVSLENRKTIATLSEEFAPDEDASPFGAFHLFSGAKTEAERLAIQQELIAQKQEDSETMAQSIRAAMTKDQFARLQQIVVQQKLRNFDYVGIVQAQTDEAIDRAARRKIEMASHKTRAQMEYAKTQLTIDMNAKSFDEVLGTNLATSLGKMLNTAGMGMNPFGETEGVEELRAKYGTDATTELPIPVTLTTAPKERIEWNDIEVPDGWKLEDAIADLEKKKKAVEQIVEGSRKWKAKRDELQQSMMNAQRSGDADLAKSLRIEFSRDYGGRAMFDTQRQFREAHEIAQEDLIQARRVVKKLGGDPGHISDRQHSFF